MVWEDHRNAEQDQTFDGADVYATRVSPSGRVLDPSGIPMANGLWRESNPRVVWDGTDYLVVWEDGRNGSIDIYARRVSVKGRLGEQFAVASGPGNQTTPAIATRGGRSLVAWTDSSFWPTIIQGAHLSSAGVSPSFPITPPSADFHGDPSVAAAEGGYLVAWVSGGSDCCDVWGALVPPEASVAAPSFAISTLPGRQDAVDVASDGTGFVAVWPDRRSGVHQLYGSAISPTGDIAVPNGTLIEPEFSMNAALAYDGSSYVLAWQDFRDAFAPGGAPDIYATRLSSEGTVLAASTAVDKGPAHQELPAVVIGGGSIFVVWQDLRSGVDYDIYGVNVSPADLSPVAAPSLVSMCAGCR